MTNDLPAKQDSTDNLPSGENVTPTKRYVFNPPIDIYESDEGLVLYADLPGVTAETIDLQVQNNKLTLFGRIRTGIPENARVVHQEYGVGDFFRSFILSDDVDHERIEAKLNNGVLKVILPRIEKNQPRRIQVNVQ